MTMADDANFAFIALNALFSVLLLAWARMVLGRRENPVLWAYVIVTLVFVYSLPQQDYSTGVGLYVLLLSHLLMLLFHAMVLFLARNHTAKMRDLHSMAVRVPTMAIIVVFGAWLVWRYVLALTHGPAALMFSRAQYFQSIEIVDFSTWEVAVSSVTSLLLMGGLALLVVCHATAQHGRSRFAYLMAAAMLVLVVLTNESPIGSRRLLLVLAALWLIINWLHSGLSAIGYVKRYAKQAGAMLLLVASLAVYYQQIRNNDFSKILSASDPSEVVLTTLEFVTTISADDNGREVEYLRSGPIDFFTGVVEASVVDGKSSKGEATSFSMALAVPKALYPGVKPVGDVDEVLAEHLNIYPRKPFLQIDYPTSLPAIGVADFGPMGVLGAGVVLSACFVLVGWLLRRTRMVPFASILMLGVLIQLIGSQEAGLSAIVSALRDAVIAFVFLWISRQAVTLWRRGAKRRISSLQLSAVPGLRKTAP